MRWLMFQVLWMLGLLCGLSVGQTPSVEVIEILNLDYRSVSTTRAASAGGDVYICGSATRTAGSQPIGFVAKLNEGADGYAWFTAVGDESAPTSADDLSVDVDGTFAFATINSESGAWSVAKLDARTGGLIERLAAESQVTGNAVGAAGDLIFAAGATTRRQFSGSAAGAFVALYSVASLSFKGGFQFGKKGDSASHLAPRDGGAGAYVLGKASNRPFLLRVDRSGNQEARISPTVEGASTYETRGIFLDLNQYVHVILDVRRAGVDGREVTELVYSDNLQRIRRSLVVSSDGSVLDSESRGVAFEPDGNAYHALSLHDPQTDDGTFSNQLNVLSQFGVPITSRELGRGRSRSRFAAVAANRNADAVLLFANNVNNQVDVTRFAPVEIVPLEEEPADAAIEYDQTITNPDRLATRSVITHLNSLVVDAAGIVGTDRLQTEFFDGDLATSIIASTTLQAPAEDVPRIIEDIQALYAGDRLADEVGVTALLTKGPQQISGSTPPPAETPTPSVGAPKPTAQVPAPTDAPDDDSPGDEDGGKLSVTIIVVIVVVSVVASIILLMALVCYCLGRYGRNHGKSDGAQSFYHAFVPVTAVHAEPVPMAPYATDEMSAQAAAYGASGTNIVDGDDGAQTMDTGYVSQSMDTGYVSQYI